MIRLKSPNRFAERLAVARKNSGQSQKEAASRLGISQSLLSHYENGQRDCSRDFIAKAASFYNVSADWLLGLSSDIRGTLSAVPETELPGDAYNSVTTLYRAVTWLCESAGELGQECEDRVRRALELSVYRLILAAGRAGALDGDWVGLDIDRADIYAEAAQESLMRDIEDLDLEPGILGNKPEYMATVIDSSEKLIKDGGL